MTDRELLELAARAAGYKVLGLASKWIAQGVSEHALLYRNERGGSSVFNPLRDPGDALRLAVELHLIVESGANRTIVFHPGADESVVKPIEWYEENGNDPLAATCRAITRAAAEIGKGMKP